MSGSKVKNGAKILFAVLIVIALSVHIGDILFGKSSVEVLSSIKSDKNRLKAAIVHLKKENAALQKEYFELRELDPDTRRNK